MRTYMTVLLGAVITIASQSFADIGSGAETGMPSGWTKTDGPHGKWTYEQLKMMCAPWFLSEWGVELDSQHQLRIADFYKERRSKQREPLFPPHFIRTKQMVGEATVVQADRGWLIGFNGGEFGGGLWWSSEDGSDTKVLSRENVHVIIPRNNEILVLTGLAHLGKDVGAVYSYRAAIDKPGELMSIANLGSEPKAALLEADGSVLIATGKRVLRMDSENRLHELYENEHMPMLYPTSIVAAPNNRFFIGMRFYVLQLQSRPDGSYEAAWFMPSSCSRFKFKNDECICTGRSRDK